MDITIEEMQAEGAKVTYDSLTSDRRPYTDRAVNCAKLTIPSLFPDSSDDKSTSWDTPYSSIGARGVNNLASKLILALLPPNSPFFRLSLDDQLKEQYSAQNTQGTDAQGNDATVLTQVETRLQQLESLIMHYLDSIQTRPTAFECIKQLLVSGNALMFFPPKEGGVKSYRLWNYVLERDSLGTIIKIVHVDHVGYATLPQDVQNLNEQEHKPEDIVDIYTYVCLSGQNYLSFQELDGKAIEGSQQTYPVDKTPYIAPRLFKVDGESYGRSFCETYYGDLKAVDSLSKAVLQFSNLAAQCYFLVNPASQTNVRKLKDAKTGDFVAGRIEDIGVLQLNKSFDLQVATQQIAAIESRLSFAFLLSSVVQREGDRVTAEEVKTVASELEDTLGGVYSLLAQEFQLPLVRRLMSQLQSQSAMPDLPKGAVEPIITTGLEALGRDIDLQKLMNIVQIAQSVPQAAQAIDWSVWLQSVLTSMGVDTTGGLVKSASQMQAEQEQQQATEAAGAGLTAAAEQAGGQA